MTTPQHNSSRVLLDARASRRRTHIVLSSFVVGLLILLLHAGFSAPTVGEDSQAGSVKQKPNKSAGEKPEAEAWFPEIEAILRQIAQQAKIELQTKNTGYFNPQNGNTAEPGTYFRMPLSDEVLTQVVDRMKLGQQKNTHDNVRRMLTQFPSGWPKLSLDHCEWFGYRHNTEDSNYGNLQVLVADRKSRTIFLLVANWDYTP